MVEQCPWLAAKDRTRFWRTNIEVDVADIRISAHGFALSTRYFGHADPAKVIPWVSVGPTKYGVLGAGGESLRTTP